MNWFRTKSRFVRLLVALFLVAQFAGVVSSPRANAQSIPNASLADHHHAHDHGDQGTTHYHGAGSPADTCCALHAYFAGVLPPVVAIETVTAVGKRFAAGADDQRVGVPAGRLDRPPRPLR